MRLVFGKEVSLKVTGADRYERTLGIVHVGGVNANLELVRQGLAWHYMKYSDDRELAQAELDARAARVGLWRGFDPMPPWEYRALKRGPQAVIGPTSATVDPQPSSATAFWLKTSSNVRHISSCRWFGKTKRGRYCGPGDGKACGECGGCKAHLLSDWRWIPRLSSRWRPGFDGGRSPPACESPVGVVWRGYSQKPLHSVT